MVFFRTRSGHQCVNNGSRHVNWSHAIELTGLISHRGVGKEATGNMAPPLTGVASNLVTASWAKMAFQKATDAERPGLRPQPQRPIPPVLHWPKRLEMIMAITTRLNCRRSHPLNIGLNGKLKATKN